MVTMLRGHRSVHACNTNTQEAEARGLQFQGYPGLHSEFQARLSCLVVFTYIPELGRLRQEDCEF